MQEEILEAFLKVGIKQQAAEAFITAHELALEHYSNENWIHTFILDKHEQIQVESPELLNDETKYFETLGFDSFPKIHPLLLERESLFNIAFAHVRDSLIVVERPLGDDFPLNSWTLVNLNANEPNAEARNILINVTDDANDVDGNEWESEIDKVRAQLKLSGNEKLWYHATTLTAATLIAANGMDLSKSMRNTDFSRGDCFYLNSNLHGKSGAIKWRYTKRKGTSKRRS